MLSYLARRAVYTVPILIGVSLVCFALVHIAPGDPLVSVLPPDASADLQKMMLAIYGFDRPHAEQFAKWIWRALHGDLGSSIATGRPVAEEVLKAVGNTLRLAVVATFVGFLFGSLFGFVAGYFRDCWIDKLASALSVFGVSVPHYWLGMVLVIIFSVRAQLAAGDRRRARRLGELGVGLGPSAPHRAAGGDHVRHPDGHHRAHGEGAGRRDPRPGVRRRLARQGSGDRGVFRHVVKNAAPTALAVMGLQLGYLLGGSILIETVFAWPGTGFLLNAAIFQRDLPLLQGTILVLALFFVLLNLRVDVVQTALDPRIERS